MRFYTCSLFRIRNVEIISKWGSIPAVSQQCILLESAVVVDAEHQFWIRGHVKAEIWKCHLFGENWIKSHMKTEILIGISWQSVKSATKYFWTLLRDTEPCMKWGKVLQFSKVRLAQQLLHENLYKSDVHWAIYIWWESSELTILMSQDLSRIKVSWFRRDVVCDQPLLTKTPSRG